MRRWKMAAILVIALFLPIGAVLAIVMPNYTWGDKGTLAVSVTLDSESINGTGRINATVVLRNTGDTKLRLAPDGYPGFHVYDSQNQVVRWRGPMAAVCPPKRLDDFEFNARLRTMNPGDSITGAGYIQNFTNRTRIGWELKAGETYHVVGSFYSNEDRGFPAYPIWEGEVKSEPKYFMVIQ